MKNARIGRGKHLIEASILSLYLYNSSYAQTDLHVCMSKGDCDMLLIAHSDGLWMRVYSALVDGIYC